MDNVSFPSKYINGFVVLFKLNIDLLRSDISISLMMILKPEKFRGN